MILINLLPHREAARKRRRDDFNASVGAAILTGALGSAIIFLAYQGRISEQQERNRLLAVAIRTMEAQIKDIASLESEIAGLVARQQAVEDLQADRNLPVHLLTELVRQLPDGVQLSAVRQENQTVSLQGLAQSNERVSELLRNFANNTPWFFSPELVEIVAAPGVGTVSGVPLQRDARAVSNFTIRVRMTRSTAPTKGTRPPGAPASAPAARAASSA